jgi:formylglycine-generating enzyme required for sulfatase activity
VDLPAFYIGKHMVTNAEYEQFVKSTGHRSPFHWPHDEIPSGKENHPVVDVTWFDACKYARWAGMRLPTEAEWEKAARGTDGRRFPWGDEFDQKKCNVEASNINGTTAVGENSPEGYSPYGCTDMAGNAWQWTSSLLKDYPYAADDGREDPEERDENRVIRGSSYSSKLDRVPAAFRNDRGHPEDHSSRLGFRCALSPPPLPE